MLNRIAKNKVLKTLENIQYGSIILITPEDKVYEFSSKKSGPRCQVKIQNWNVIYSLLIRGDLAFAEAFINQKIITNDLTALLHFVLLNEKGLENFIFGNSLLSYLGNLFYLFQSNNKKQSRKNIASHYDLGNDFYSVWLDPSMTYSSAIFDKNNNDLLSAQNNKYDRILKKFADKSGKILEIGCGWGGFLERAVNNSSHQIKSITISKKQFDYSQKRLAEYKDQALIAFEDYRDQIGKFDYITSIEMFEAVGKTYWKTYFDKLSHLLKDRGKAVVQTITIGEEYFKKYNKTTDVIRTHIFPGGMLPTKNIFVSMARESGLELSEKYCFGKDYATTLSHWLNNFNNNHQVIKNLGFSDHFIRLWQFYLASCEAAFLAGRTDVVQFELTKLP